jgi:uncharacterized protein YraI
MKKLMFAAAAAAIAFTSTGAVVAQSDWPGYSYGGVLRAGPGMEYQQVGSLGDGDWIAVLQDTGVWMDGYQWFYIDSPLGTGYHWGGIMCIDGQDHPEGMFGVC